MRALLPVLFLSLAVPLFAATIPECATSPANNERLRELDAWTAAKVRQSAAKGIAKPNDVAARNGVFVLQADDLNAPFRRPFDLEGQTLVLQPRDATTFTASREPLVFDEDAGPTLALNGAASSAAVSIGFDFPFFDRVRRQLFVSAYGAIYFAAPKPSTIDQRGDLEAATVRDAVIAPFLTTPFSNGLAGVRMKESAGAATITWSDGSTYAFQAVLAASGEIRFSYKQMSGLTAGAIVVTSGSEPWRDERAPILFAADPTGDVDARVPAALAPMLDITSAGIERVSGLDMIEVRITTREPLQLSRVPAGDLLYVTVSINGTRVLRYYLDATLGESYLVPAWGTKDESPAARVEGSTLVLDVLQDYLAAFAPNSQVTASTTLNSARVGDGMGLGRLTLTTPARATRTDFSALTAPVDLRGPIEEAFTLPVLNVARAWQQVRDAYGLSDADVDGVAFYQTFLTDIILYASAYSTGGNPGAKGIADFPDVGPNVPREPALMHMNKVGFGPNRDARAASHVIMHELGHRWLYYLSIQEDGERRQSLNPLGAHPAQFVDTRAAFPVYGANDSSVMGGGTFVDHGDATFTSTEYASYGYSWLDLYLMGLAEPGEVLPWYYIADSQPRLADAYYPPQGKTFSGRRRDVVVQQVLEAMGSRSPAYPNTQRTFRVAFVLLAPPERPATETEVALVEQYRSLLRTNFPTATGDRAGIALIDAPTQPPRRRAAR